MTSPDKLRFEQKQQFNNRTVTNPKERETSRVNDVDQRFARGEITKQTQLNAKK